VILVPALVLFVKQFLQFRHLLSLHLSVFVFVPKQKKPNQNKKKLMVAFFTSDILHDFGFVF